MLITKTTQVDTKLIKLVLYSTKFQPKKAVGIEIVLLENGGNKNGQRVMPV
jgi:hypothetical protein